MLYSTVAFRVTFSGLAKYSVTQTIARLLCDSRATCQLPSAVLSKRFAKLNMKFKNHQNQLRRIINNL